MGSYSYNRNGNVTLTDGIEKTEFNGSVDRKSSVPKFSKALERSMRGYLVFLLFFAVVLSLLLRRVSGSVISLKSSSDHDGSVIPKQFNSLLPPTPKQDVALVATLDGTVYLVDTDSREIRWSFSSGLPIYSSYQAALDNHDGGDDDGDRHNRSELSRDFYYIDCGDDWQLYLHSKRSGKLRKVPSSAEELVKMTPVISEDGEITLGIKKTSAFVVDAKTGRVVHTYRLDSAPPLLGVQEATENALLLAKDAKELVEASSSSLGMPRHLIYVTRTDYTLQHYSPNSTKILWNVTFADIEAEFRCQGLGGSLGGISTNAEKDIDEFEWKLPCQMKTSVVRIHDHSLLEFNKPMITWLTDRANFLPTPDHPLVLVPDKRFMLALPTDGERPMLALPTSETKHPEILDGNADASNNKSSLFKFVMASPLVYVCAAILSTLGFVSCNYMPLRKQDKLNKPVEDFKVHTGAAKKKRSRRSGSSRNSPYDDRKQKYLSLGSKVEDTKGLPQIEQIDKMSRAITDIGDGNVHGCRIGKLHISKTEIAKGSNGTVVLEGIYDGRPVAVKRLVQTHHDVALKEIENLIASDQHPNIVRWYGVEFDRDFVYLALERCSSNLSDLIYVYSECYQNQSHYLPGHEKKFELWKANGYPSAPLLKLMRDVVLGLAHLHELGIIHRDLKPQNVLIINEKPFCAKLSDMGISKRLLGDSTSLTQSTTGYGSSGWQAPEQLHHERQTRAVDLFSLGCLLFFCVTGGKHPFGESIERDVNIVNDRKDLFLVEHIPEAVNLFSLLLDHNPNNRPKAQQVLSHPLFWTSEKRLSFLQDVSDRVELEDREGESEVLNALETISTVTLGGKWDEKMETIFINNIGRYRRYKFDSVRDLLRVIRNKSHHYRELPEEIKELLGSHPVGFESYFSSRFPKLLIEVYKVICQHCREEEFFHKYTD